jgi:hypothetical protein
MPSQHIAAIIKAMSTPQTARLFSSIVEQLPSIVSLTEHKIKNLKIRDKDKIVSAR